MNRFRKHAAARKSPYCAGGGRANILGILLLAAVTAVLSSCGSSSTNSEQSGPQIAGNWQFTLTTDGDSFVSSPLQGGFLLQENGSLTGQIVFAIVLPSGSTTAICNSGAAPVTGTISGKTVSLTAVVGTLDQDGNPATQTLKLTGGTLSANNSTIQNGTYSLTAGFALVNQQLTPCGAATDQGSWSASSLPTLTGGFQGFFHSVSGGASLDGQDFPVSGTLTQGPNTGASYTAVTGTLVFKDPATLFNDYPFLTTASVNGEVSGNTVSLQIYGSNGVVVGQVGGVPPFPQVTLSIGSAAGFVMQGRGGYALSTKSCPAGSAGIGDVGNVCLAFGRSTGCTQPITLSPLSAVFLPQLLGSPPTTQTITISNTTNSALAGAQINLTENDSQFFYPNGGDFNGVPNFTVLQTGQASDCATLAPLGSAFSLETSCNVTVQFSPQQSCPWMPLSYFGDSTPPFVEQPSLCPNPPTATLAVTVPASATKDSSGTFSIPISGTGLSAIVPSTGELDFSSETPGEATPPQTLIFTNQSAKAVQILPGASTCNTLNQQHLPYPLAISSPVAGFQIDRVGFPQAPNTLSQATILPIATTTPPTVSYACDFDSQTKVANFQIAPALVSTCLAASQGVLLQPQQSCTLQITFAPQPEAWQTIPANSPIGLDYFLELNTVQCNSGESNCEIDSGRFPVELKTNPPSPLRLLPTAGLEFGTLVEGTTSAPLTVTLFNDPVDANSATVNITSKIVSGDYFESDNCPPSLAPNESCTITITFTPKVIGFDHSTFVISYNTSTQVGLVQTLFLRGAGQ